MKRNRNKNGSLSFKFNADLDTSEGNHSAARCTVGEISRVGSSPLMEGSAIVILRVSGMEDLKILRSTTEPKQHGIPLDLLTTRQHVTNLTRGVSGDRSRRCQSRTASLSSGGHAVFGGVMTNHHAPGPARPGRGPSLIQDGISAEKS